MKIAITGTIGSGKSTVSNIFRKFGYDVYDADAVSRRLTEKDGQAYKQIIRTFEGIADKDGNLDRKKLAGIIFNDPDRKLELENIIYPFLIEDMKSAMLKTEIFIAEVPVLFEAGFDSYFDKVILVKSNEDIIYHRLAERGMSDSEIKERIRNQFSVAKKTELSDHIIENNADMATLEEKVYQYIKENLEQGE